MRPVREFLHRLGGVHRDRPLPALAEQTFRQWWATHEPPAEAPRGDVVYFDDTFTGYYHPEAGAAAVRVLETLGYRVTVVPQLACCGRPAISKGQLGTAREWARRNVLALHPYAARGVPIVGTEPSCLLALRDEYPELIGGEHARTVASQALLIEELLMRVEGEQPGAVSSLFRRDLDRSILLHGHCHQKALAGMEATLGALALVPGYRAELIDSGCCGMAGSFGFEAEHYDVSREMGALRLFPAVEAANEDTAIAITGVSCRQQLEHFTNRPPRHVVELLADALQE
jgi:Fe-S oxidoreductase